MVPADDVEQKVLDEIFRVLMTPEIIMNIYKKAEDGITVSKNDIISALYDLSEIWEYLYPTEQHKIARLLINEANVSEEGTRLRMSSDGMGKLGEQKEYPASLNNNAMIKVPP